MINREELPDYTLPTDVIDAPVHFERSETNGRENNEDSFQVFALVPQLDAAPITFLCLADGMGGHAFGEEVSRETLKKLGLSLFEEICIQNSLNSAGAAGQTTPETLGAALLRGMQLANAHIRRMVEANHWEKAGSTLVVAGVTGDAAVVVNVGDSPLFHYEAQSGQLRKVTDDHSVAGLLARAGLITPEMARVHEGKSRLEYHIGRAELPSDDPLHIIPLAPGDRLLLCSDGISGLLAEDTILSAMGDAEIGLAVVADQLIAAAQAAGESDNQTVVLWQHPEKRTVSPSISKTTAAPLPTTMLGVKTLGMNGLGFEEDTSDEVQDDLPSPNASPHWVSAVPSAPPPLPPTMFGRRAKGRFPWFWREDGPDKGEN